MNLTTVPRRIARLQYSLVRAPLSILERRVATRYLPDEAPLRLRFERVLGTLDGAAGRLLADDDLARRGQVLRTRVSMLDKAATLEHKAQQRRDEADEKLRDQQTQAATVRRQAARGRRRDVSAALERVQEEKQDAESKAQAQLKADTDKVVRAERKQARAAASTARVRKDAVNARQHRVNAPAKQQLDDASNRTDAARGRRQDADRLAGLAAQERQQRAGS